MYEIMEDMIKEINDKEMWKVAFKVDETTCSATSCPLLRKWIGTSGYTDFATDMSQFDPPDKNAVTPDDLPDGFGSTM